MDEILFIVADLMKPATVFVTDRDTVATAAKLIAQHNLPALPVVEGDRIRGLVTPLLLLTAPPYRLVADLMTVEGITPATPAQSLAQAYALMTGQGLDVLPVVDNGKIVGQISSTAILRAQGQQTDPLTGLPFSTATRAWAMAALERGHEVTILFLDLDNFGAVNKLFGHVAGDNVLCTVVQLLAGLIDADTDVLCRYGGDEFAIATTRRGGDARALMERIQDVVVVTVGTGEMMRQVTVSVGIAGGRRAEGRKRAHIAATVDDLLTMASRASTAAKAAKGIGEAGALRGAAVGGRATPPAGASYAADTGVIVARTQEPRLRLVDVTVTADETGSTAAVTLRQGSHEGVGRASGHVRGHGALFLVASATVDAIRRVAGDVHAYVVEELHEVPVAAEKLVVAVLTSSSGHSRALTGSARAADLPHAVTKAILAALNRRLSKPPADPSDERCRPRPPRLHK